MKVQLFIPCYVDQLFPKTGMNMVKVLEKAGCEIKYNPNQTCCGQPAFNSGYWKEAAEVGEKFIRDFRGEEYIVSPSGSCTAMVKNFYHKLFEKTTRAAECNLLSKRIFEFSDFLVNVLKIEKFGSKLKGTATYHDSCHALRELKIKNEPRVLLQHVEGLKLVEMNEAETCCGFGGTFAVKFEPISIGMVQQKCDNILATKADYVISTDASCLMQIDGYMKKNNMPVKTMHLADVLASGW